MQPLYSHRQRASLPRDVEVIEQPVWISFRELLLLRLEDHSFAGAFGKRCIDCMNAIDTDQEVFERSLRMEVPRLGSEWKYSDRPLPETTTVFDLIEFLHQHIANAERGSIHRRDCYHRIIIPNTDSGRALFRSQTNRILDRERIGYYLDDDGQIKRVGAPILSETISESEFNTGDSELDYLLSSAQRDFVSRNSDLRQQALKSLWAAWEHLKTLEPGKDKKASVTVLLDRVADGPMRERLEAEAKELTEIGNKFRIRHSETDRHPLDDDRHVDYLFHRMFSLVYLLLDGTGRVGRSG